MGLCLTVLEFNFSSTIKKIKKLESESELELEREARPDHEAESLDPDLSGLRNLKGIEGSTGKGMRILVFFCT